MAYFAASCDDSAVNQKFAQELELDYPILSDTSRQTAQAFGALTPERKAPARWTYYIGKDGKILFVDKAVKAPSAGADVAAKLKELGIAARK